jgi:hypothetical protein
MQLPFVILLRKSLMHIHERNKSLDKANRALHNDNVSLRLSVKRREDDIELLKEKASRVGISKLQNEIVRLNEKVSNLELQSANPPASPLVPPALVSTAEGTAPEDIGQPDLFVAGTIQDVSTITVSSNNAT